MKDFVLSDKQLERIAVDAIESEGFRPEIAQQIYKKSFPTTGKMILYYLIFSGYDARPSDLIEYCQDPNVFVVIKDGVAQFHRSDLFRLARNLFLAGRFTPAARERKSRGVTAEQAVAELESEFRNMLDEKLLHACRN